jgi:hypothetical protein
MTDVVGLIDEKAAEVAIVRRVYKERDAAKRSSNCQSALKFGSRIASSEDVTFA